MGPAEADQRRTPPGPTHALPMGSAPVTQPPSPAPPPAEGRWPEAAAAAAEGDNDFSELLGLLTQGGSAPPTPEAPRRAAPAPASGGPRVTDLRSQNVA